MSSRITCRARLQVEVLESRWMPATLLSPTQLSYQDIDGDLIRVTFSKPILTSTAVANDVFKFNVGDVNGNDGDMQQLWKIDLAGLAGAQGTDITVELDANPEFARVLGGNDSRVNVGFINAEGIDLGKVVVRGDLGRIVAGDDDVTTAADTKLRVESMGVYGITTQQSGGTLETNFNGLVGKIVTTGAVQDAHIQVYGALRLLRLGALIGGDQEGSGQVITAGSISEIVVDRIEGGAGSDSGSILALDSIGSITTDGSITGGTGSSSGLVAADAEIGAVHIGGSLLGGMGEESGVVAANRLGSVTILGYLNGGTGNSSGGIVAGKKIGQVSVGISVNGGIGLESGVIRTFNGGIKSIDIGGSLFGGGGHQSGWIDAAGGLGSLTIGQHLEGGGGELSGRVESSMGSIGDITIGGSIGIDGTMAPAIAARDNLGNIVVKDGIFGQAGARVVISAGGVGSDGPATIGNISVIGEVSHADILAGYNAVGTATPIHTNGDARIGKVTATGDWLASNLVAGVDRGADGYFGTDDDDDSPIGSSSFISKIGAVTIGGVAEGTLGGGDHFGIVAEQIKSFSVNGFVQVLSPDPLTDRNLDFSNSTFDMFLSEVQA